MTVSFFRFLGVHLGHLKAGKSARSSPNSRGNRWETGRDSSRAGTLMPAREKAPSPAGKGIVDPGFFRQPGPPPSAREETNRAQKIFSFCQFFSWPALKIKPELFFGTF